MINLPYALKSHFLTNNTFTLFLINKTMRKSLFFRLIMTPLTHGYPGIGLFKNYI